MPELPDVTVYAECLTRALEGATVTAVRIASPFFLRSVALSPASLVGAKVEAVTRLHKRLVFAFDGDRYAVLHLMVAGRLRLVPAAVPPARVPGKVGLAALDTDRATVLVTEASSKKRASLHLVSGRAELDAFAPAGLDVFEADLDALVARLRSERHTLKRSLTDPRLFTGIGNAYSDEILHDAKLSPFALSTSLDDAAARGLFGSARRVLTRFTEAIRRDAARTGFPEKVTAFRADMAVHGRYGAPCPACGTKVQRIRYADNEANYCPVCQTGGRLLADRALSRLLKDDFPRTLDDLEAHLDARRRP